MESHEKLFMRASEAFTKELIDLIKILIREQLNQKGETEIYYSVKDTSKLLDVSTVTVYNWMREGRIRRRKIGGKVFIPKCEVLNVRKNG